MNNKKWESLMDKLYGTLIPTETWWSSQVMRNNSIAYLCSKGFVSGEHIKKWTIFKKND